MTTKFGWCLDGRHTQCKQTMSYSVKHYEHTLTCGCSCHDTTDRGPVYGD